MTGSPPDLSSHSGTDLHVAVRAGAADLHVPMLSQGPVLAAIGSDA